VTRKPSPIPRFIGVDAASLVERHITCCCLQSILALKAQASRSCTYLFRKASFGRASDRACVGREVGLNQSASIRRAPLRLTGLTGRCIRCLYISWCHPGLCSLSMRYICSCPFFASPLRTLAVHFLDTSLKNQRPLNNVSIPGRITAHLAASVRSYRTASTDNTEDMETVDTSGRLSVLRNLMRERKIDVYGMYRE
jgi:hypothetical protein